MNKLDVNKYYRSLWNETNRTFDFLYDNEEHFFSTTSSLTDIIYLVNL